jgi:integrase
MDFEPYILFTFFLPIFNRGLSIMGKLIDTKLRQAKPVEGKSWQLPDGNGLYLDMLSSGSKVWRYRFRLHGKLIIFTIGNYPAITLHDAREKHLEVRKLVKAGTDPRVAKAIDKHQKQTEQTNTFQSVAELWIEKKMGAKSPYYLRQIKAGFANHLYPKIGKLPLTAVDTHTLLTVLEHVALTAPTTALNLKIWIGAVFRFGIGRRLATLDPTAALKGQIVKPKVTHHARLTPEQMPEFVRKADAYQGIAGTALKLLLYTFVRSSELRCAVWSEFDLDNALWRIPADRMKARREHLVPLSAQALALLKPLHDATGHSASGLLFPNQRDHTRPMGTTSFNHALKYMGYAGKFSAHGFRATASTLLNEAGFHADLIEIQLAHIDRDQTRGSYNAALYLDRRREMMARYSGFIDALAAGKNNVVGLFSNQPMRAA